MKRISFFLAMLFLFVSLTIYQANAAEEVVLYNAKMRVSSSLYAISGDTSKIVGGVNRGSRVAVLSVDPAWAKISINGAVGYVRRSCLIDVSAVDPIHTPPYGVEVNRYIAIAAGVAPVRVSANEDAEALITLQEGARVSFISIENGWGKLVFHRQYAYIDTRFISELIPVYSDAADIASHAPVAAYTSFYKITTDELNQGRMANIVTACEKLSAIVLQPGEAFNFNRDIGPYSNANGYTQAPVLVDGKLQPGYGGGTCQVSSTLYNVVLQLPGLNVLQRRAHGLSGASYLPHGMDAAVGNDNLNFRFRNAYDFPVCFDASAQDGALYISIFRYIGK